MVDPVSIGAAVGWGVSAVGWLASPIISRVLNKGFAHLDFDATEKVKILDLQVLQLQRVMEVVDKSTYRVRLEPLLDKLKSALYKAEDILDAVEYQRLEKQIQDGSMPQRKRDWLKKNLMSAGTSSPVTDMISKVKLKKSLEKIASAISDACKVLEQLNLQGVSNDNGRRAVATNSRGAVTTTAPLLRVLGRDQDRDKIIAMLHENTVNGTYYSVIGIHGIAGSGKSTLAKCVYDHEKRNKQEKAEGHFDIIMWIHVSQKFDLESIFREMFEGATRKKCDKFNSCNTLKENLEEELHGKRILLVLDDVWYNNRNSGDREELQKLISPLNVGKAGSRILVTSRTEAALVALGAVKERCIPISDLDDDAFLEMFKHYALPHPWSGGNDRKTLEMIGKYIAKNLKKSPLAARTVGSRLRETQTVEFWMSQKDRDLMKNTMGSLWWSYQYLDEQVRRCFAYCSIFPRRHCLYRDELVKLWVAEGFIKTTNPEEEMEDVAQEYLDELLSASFLQFGGEKYKINYFTIHDLLFDLAEEVAGRDCFRIEEGFTGEVPQDVRYLFVGAYDREMLTEKISGLQNLRTLIIDDVIWVNSRDEFKVFLRLSKLRVLKLSVIMNIGKFGLLARTFSFPDSIGDLKHLRYLAFHTLSEHIILPHTFSKLYHIQVVDFGVCANLEFSSGEDMMNLINLRRVISKADLEFSNIGRLTWLQMLPFFTIKRKHGYESRQLKHLNKLQGKLQIHGLENIQNKEEAVEVNLADKEKLTELVLVWDHDDSWSSPGVQAEVLEGLCPSKYLKRLEIRNYHGKRIPTWLMGKHNGSPKNLQELRFSRCSWDWDALPEHLTLLKNAIMCDRW